MTIYMYIINVQSKRIGPNSLCLIPKINKLVQQTFAIDRSIDQPHLVDYKKAVFKRKNKYF
jgi:hypothetical protein